MAHSIATYVFLLCALGGCPHLARAGQREGAGTRQPPPLLPVEEAWTVALPSPASSPGTLDDTRVYIPLESGPLIALNRETGVEEWSVAIEDARAPVADEGVLYVAGQRECQALDAATGMPLWSVALDGGAMARPVLQGSTLLLLVEPGQLLALRASDGAAIWKRDVGPRSGNAAMAADAASVTVSLGNRISRFSLHDGQTEWERELSGVLSPPAVGGTRVFVGSTDNHFYALDAETGRIAWKWRSGGDVVGSVADDRLVYVASLDNLLRALRPGSGNQIWKRALTTRAIAPPIVFDGIVLAVGNDPTLATFDSTSGAPIAMYSAPGDLLGAPVVDSTLQPFRVAMIAVTRDARAIGLRPTGMMFREPVLGPLESLPGKPLDREPIAPPAPGNGGSGIGDLAPASGDRESVARDRALPSRSGNPGLRR